MSSRLRMLARLSPGALALGLLLTANQGCSGEDPSSAPGASAPPAPADTLAGCEDNDGDGFGPSCAAGSDCDDGDPQVTNQCYRCQEPGTEGCACAAEGSQAPCGVTVSQQQASLECGKGVSRCENGGWTKCEVTSTFTYQKPATPGLDALGLGQASKCTNNPCDPYCVQFPDTPQGSASSGTGIVETPGGISVPANAQPQPPSVCTGQYKSCTHALCETGGPLAVNCDTTGPSCVTKTRNGRTYLFCNSLQTQTSAQLACAKEGLSLVTINDAAENTWVANEAKLVSTSRWYLGLNDILNEGNFQWANGAVPSHLSWASGEPNASASNTDDCVEQDPNTGLWYDVACSQTRRYICEGVPLGGGCVQSVCSQRASCCNTTWDGTCVGLAKSLCNIDCAVGAAGECVTCFKDNVDHDGDGYSFQQGDCRDCDPSVNPGAFDFPGNGEDENCDGTPDNEATSCDQGLPLATNSANQHIQAMDLCRFTTDGATGPQRTWGVVESRLVQANASSTPMPRQYGILDRFGNSTATDSFGRPTNAPRLNQRMAAFSSGAARNPGQTDYINPNGQVSSFANGTYAAPPAGFPKNSAGCPSGTAAYDSSGVWFRVRVPTNAQSFKFNFNFFSSEYPEWVCTSYNDAFIALLYSNHPLNVANASGPNTRNISFDSLNRPVTVNVGFFSIPGSSTGSHPMLNGTGFDGNCGGQVCGGATNWLKTQAPVLAGETITMHFSIWDTGDQVWDSTVLLDAWEWSASPSGIKTAPEIPPPQPKYYEGSFIRDYDTTNVCPQGTAVSWGLWTWSTSTPTDTSVEFYVKSAETAAELASATEVPLRFSAPPGPAGLVGQNAVARASLGTQIGGAVVSETLKANGFSLVNPYLRVRSRLRPSTDQYQAPTLQSWNLQISCVPSELSRNSLDKGGAGGDPPGGDRGPQRGLVARGLLGKSARRAARRERSPGACPCLLDR